jgi:hypothetical protein
MSIPSREPRAPGSRPPPHRRGALGGGAAFLVPGRACLPHPSQGPAGLPVPQADRRQRSGACSGPGAPCQPQVPGGQGEGRIHARTPALHAGGSRVPSNGPANSKGPRGVGQGASTNCGPVPRTREGTPHDPAQTATTGPAACRLDPGGRRNPGRCVQLAGDATVCGETRRGEPGGRGGRARDREADPWSHPDPRACPVAGGVLRSGVAARIAPRTPVPRHRRVRKGEILDAAAARLLRPRPAGSRALPPHRAGDPR